MTDAAILLSSPVSLQPVSVSHILWISSTAPAPDGCSHCAHAHGCVQLLPYPAPSVCQRFCYRTPTAWLSTRCWIYPLHKTQRPEDESTGVFSTSGLYMWFCLPGFSRLPGFHRFAGYSPALLNRYCLIQYVALLRCPGAICIRNP